jgi:hypothetical protein
VDLAPPNAPDLANPDPARLRRLLNTTGLTLAQAAVLCGVSLRTMERYLSPCSKARGDWIPYPLQFTLEALCLAKRKEQP